MRLPRPCSNEIYEREMAAVLQAALPTTVDPYSENGEFHAFA